MIDRRKFLQLAASNIALTVLSEQLSFRSAYAGSSEQRETTTADRTAEQWMDEVMRKKQLGGQLFFSRFVEPMYFLTQPICWEPDAGRKEHTGLPVVQAPAGFVTDLASVPQPFWNILPRDGEYAYAAILHDFMYWTQTYPRDVADRVLKAGMEDLGVKQLTITTIYEAVHHLGDNAWRSNGNLKSKGENRFLKNFPKDPTTRWINWKKSPDVFFAHTPPSVPLEKCPAAP